MSVPRAELIFVRSVTALLWFCLFPFAPLWLYLSGWVPLTANRLALIVGCSLLMVVPVAAPQSVQADARILAEIKETQILVRENARLIHQNERSIAAHLSMSAHGEARRQLDSQDVRIALLERLTASLEGKIYGAAATAGAVSGTVLAFASWVIGVIVNRVRRNGAVPSKSSIEGS